MTSAGKPSLHARLAAGRQVESAVAEAVDVILAADLFGGPIQREVLDPLVAAGTQVARLRDGEFGSLTIQQREALNVVHGRLSHVALLLSEMHDGTSLAARSVEPVLAAD